MIKRDRASLEQLYSQLGYIPLFFRLPWLDLFCRGNLYHEVVCENDTPIVGFVCQKRRRFGYEVFDNPFLTPYTGFIFNDKLDPAIIWRACREILDQRLNSHLEIRLHPEIKVAINGLQAKIKLNTRRTFRFRDLSVKDVWKGARKGLINEIRAFNKAGNIQTGTEPGEVYALVNNAFNQARNILPYTEEEFLHIDKSLSEGGIRKIYFASNEKSQICGTHYVIGDGKWSYALFSAINKRASPRGTHAALRWQALKDALQMGKGYDLCGSSIVSIRKKNEAFGIEPVKYSEFYASPNFLYHFFLRSKRQFSIA